MEKIHENNKKKLKDHYEKNPELIKEVVIKYRVPLDHIEAQPELLLFGKNDEQEVDCILDEYLRLKK